MCLFEVAARGSFVVGPRWRCWLQRRTRAGQDARTARETMKQTIIQEWITAELQTWSVIIIS